MSFCIETVSVPGLCGRSNSGHCQSRQLQLKSPTRVSKAWADNTILPNLRQAIERVRYVPSKKTAGDPTVSLQGPATASGWRFRLMSGRALSGSTHTRMFAGRSVHSVSRMFTARSWKFPHSSFYEQWDRMGDRHHLSHPRYWGLIIAITQGGEAQLDTNKPPSPMDGANRILKLSPLERAICRTY